MNNSEKPLMPEMTATGINESKISIIKGEIQDYATRINSIFGDMTTLVEESKNYFNCESGDLFRNHFLLLKENFSVVNQNILNYADDLTNVQLHYQKKNENAVSDLGMYRKETAQLVDTHSAYIEGKEEELL